MEYKLWILFSIILFMGVGCANVKNSKDIESIQNIDNSSITTNPVTETSQNESFVTYSPQIFENCTKNITQYTDICIGNVLYHYNSIQVCDVLTGRNKDYCYMKFNEIHIGYGQCEKINLSLFKSQCFEALANKTNMTACLLAHSDRCLYEIAVSTDNLTICDMNGETYKSMCYSDIASNRLNASICDIFYNKTGDNLGACYSSVALKKRDITICQSLGNRSDHKYTTDFRTQCIKLYAHYSSNADVCDLIISDERNECINMANNPNYFDTCC